MAKRYFSFFGICIAAVALGSSSSGWAAEATSATASASAAVVTKQFQPPYLLTDVGQGNGAKVVRTLMRKVNELPIELKEIAKPDDLASVKTLLVAVGASTKGLGAAGFDADTEAKRAKELLDAAKAKNIPIVAIHLGGQARRGELSDQFNKLVFERAAYAVVWKEGNEDNFFTKLGEDHHFPVKVVEQKTEAANVLKEILTPVAGGEAKAASEPKTE